jgi:hypothetical protein
MLGAFILYPDAGLLCRRYRRHIHWENAIVLPSARARLTQEDIEELSPGHDESRPLVTL